MNGGSIKPTVAGTFSANGHVMLQNLVCPATVTESVEFTAAPGVLTIYQYDAKSVSVWTKQ